MDIEQEFTGTSPAPFVGRFGYPHVSVGILSTATKHELLDSPRAWAARGLGIDDIVSYRSRLVNSLFRAGIMEKSKLIDLAQAIGQSRNPVDVEIHLEHKPVFRIQHDEYVPPMGPNAKLARATLISNPVIPRSVDKVVSDDDLHAKEAVSYLWQKGFEENSISKILATGCLGVLSERRLVPTRWSITATDDMIGKDLIDQLHDLAHDSYCGYFGGYLGNYYIVLTMPGPWCYELFEIDLRNGSVWTDFEPTTGRTSYAYNTTGGYYAARLPILERLIERKRTAQVLAIRFITTEYTIPLGVWVVREATRKAMASRPIEFSDASLLLRYASLIAEKKFGYDLSPIERKSVLLNAVRTQKRLKDFL